MILGIASVLCPIGQAQEQKTPGRAILFRQPPLYPPQAQSFHLQGKVKVSVVVASDGSVTSTEVIGGSPVLVDAALKAIMRWKWERAAKPTNELVEIKFDDVR